VFSGVFILANGIQTLQACVIAKNSSVYSSLAFVICPTLKGCQSVHAQIIIWTKAQGEPDLGFWSSPDDYILSSVLSASSDGLSLSKLISVP
jgi:hypothetical protein